MFLDACYEKVRWDGQDPERSDIDCDRCWKRWKTVSFWFFCGVERSRTALVLFFENLAERGIQNMPLIISDDQHGLRKAWQAVFTGIPWLRCQFHLQQNASQYLPHKYMLAEVDADIRVVFNAPDRSQAEQYLHHLVEKYSHSASALAE